MKHKDHYCINCEEVFEVTSENDMEPKYCPFCGEELEDEDAEREPIIPFGEVDED